MSKKIKKIKFKKHDFLRVLLTDTLPYEVPILFSNNGFYERLKENADVQIFTECKLPLLSTKIDFTIPYDYSIKKDSLDTRALSIVHPAIQKEFSELYEKYSQLMIGLCSRSSYSLRKPSRVATHYFEKKRASKFLWSPIEVETETDGFSSQNKNASSFFAYSSYNLIYKFYESSEFHELEKKFSGMRSLDISKCFNHIYTHSFTWAAKSKAYGKENISLSTFEGAFDKVMQRSNYNETNGIVIGPEISRIFAEVILQYIDLNVEKNLEKTGRKIGVDYEIRRYVDDYFIFFNDVIVADYAQREIAKNLSDFKLYLNEAKTKTSARPFVTGQSGAKIELAKLIDSLFKNHTRTPLEIRSEYKEKIDHAARSNEDTLLVRAPFNVKYVGNEERLSASYIRDVKHIISQNISSYEGISNYFFSIFGQKIYTLMDNVSIDDANEKELNRLSKFLRSVLEIIFFVYAMSPRVRATYQISSLCFALNHFAAGLPIDSAEYLKNYISGQLRSVLFSFDHTSGNNIEVINLLTVLSSFGEEYYLGKDDLLRIYGISQREDLSLIFPIHHFGYFQIVTLLHYIKDIPRYSEIKNSLCIHAMKLYSDLITIETIKRSAELTMLFFDFLRCPYILSTTKQELAKTVLRKETDKNLALRVAALQKIIDKGDWFFAWSGSHDLGEVLWKKELKSAY